MKKSIKSILEINNALLVLIKDLKKVKVKYEISKFLLSIDTILKSFDSVKNEVIKDILEKYNIKAIHVYEEDKVTLTEPYKELDKELFALLEKEEDLPELIITLDDLNDTEADLLVLMKHEILK